MSLAPDLIVERRRLRRRASMWRFLAVLAIVTAVLIGLGGRDGLDELLARPYVARIDVSGLITEDTALNRTLFELAKDDSVKALIVRIDSPGGTTVGAETLFGAIRAVAAKKPVVAVMGSVAASGGYIAALAADHIVAAGNTLTGSIGVLFEAPNFEGLMDKVGVHVDQITSGPLKGQPNPFHPLTAPARAVMQALIQDSYGWFVGLVAERRNIPLDKVKTLGDGRIYSGRQALADHLIDQIGDERVARQWLVKEKGIPARLAVRDIEPEKDKHPVTSLGGRAVAALLGGVLPARPLALDGLISVWQAPR
jgi:protease-4